MYVSIQTTGGHKVSSGLSANSHATCGRVLVGGFDSVFFVLSLFLTSSIVFKYSIRVSMRDAFCFKFRVVMQGID